MKSRFRITPVRPHGKNLDRASRDRRLRMRAGLFERGFSIAKLACDPEDVTAPATEPLRLAEQCPRSSPPAGAPGIELNSRHRGKIG